MGHRARKVRELAQRVCETANENQAAGPGENNLELSGLVTGCFGTPTQWSLSFAAISRQHLAVRNERLGQALSPSLKVVAANVP